MILGDVGSVPLNHTTEGLVSGCRCSSLLASLLFLCPPLPGSDQIQPPWPHLAPFPSPRPPHLLIPPIATASPVSLASNRQVLSRGFDTAGLLCAKDDLSSSAELSCKHPPLPTPPYLPTPPPRWVALPNSPALTAHDTPSLCFVFCRVFFFPSPIPSAFAFQREVNLSKLGAQNGNY